MRSKLVLSALAGLLLVAGCGGGDDTTTVTVRETVTETAASSVPSEAPTLVALYFLQDEKVWPEQRGLITGPAIATNTVHQLFEGTESELTSAIPPETRLRSLAIEDGVASIELDPAVTDRKALAQLTYTLTQFDSVKRVSFNGDRPVGRGAFEEETPAIIVESPLSGEEVESGFEATGTANTFEATFQYELRDADDKILKKDFVTATSGSGTRGTFRFTVPYEGSGPGRLVVFEISAEDGSRTNERSIPLSLR
ncbi:MAG TPA: Gmad2 immunoglobulin-like domain-containing protein [Gaiellaceae bacterium]|nr:Gmad2 immunoglobulin-like domain-containing protein [Gaiellaceae bacterium]